MLTIIYPINQSTTYIIDEISIKLESINFNNFSHKIISHLAIFGQSAQQWTMIRILSYQYIQIMF